MSNGQTPVLVLNTNSEREHGRKAQLANVAAAKAVSDIIRTSLGPLSMLKMILDPMGGIVMTNDGNVILREVDVSHPAAKSMIELARTQDEEVGDGTTSVIILAGEMLAVSEVFLMRNMHPKIIVTAYMKALDTVNDFLKNAAINLDTNDEAQMMSIIRSTLGTKYVSRFGDMICKFAYEAVMKVKVDPKDGTEVEIDVKKYAKVEKIPGGMLEDSLVMNGLCMNKDVTHPRMKRMIKNPRVMLLDCPMEYKKMESQANIEITQESDWEAILKQEEDYIENLCNDIIALKPDLVFTEKGVSDLAQHFLVKAGIAVIRRVRKTDNNRVARVTGATIMSETSNVREDHIGTKCGLFEVRKIGDEFFTFLEECEDPKACTILLRGGSKDVLNEMENNLKDAMSVARNIVFDSRILPGGGATEMACAKAILDAAKSYEGVGQWPMKACAAALEVIPRTLMNNCGCSTISLLTELRAKHAAYEGTVCCPWGVEGKEGTLAKMTDTQVYEPFVVKNQTIKTAIESACMIFRIDDIVSGVASREQEEQGPAPDIDP